MALNGCHTSTAHGMDDARRGIRRHLEVESRRRRPVRRDRREGVVEADGGAIAEHVHLDLHNLAWREQGLERQSSKLGEHLVAEAHSEKGSARYEPCRHELAEPRDPRIGVVPRVAWPG